MRPHKVLMVLKPPGVTCSGFVTLGNLPPTKHQQHPADHLRQEHTISHLHLWPLMVLRSQAWARGCGPVFECRSADASWFYRSSYVTETWRRRSTAPPLDVPPLGGLTWWDLFRNTLLWLWMNIWALILTVADWLVDLEIWHGDLEFAARPLQSFNCESDGNQAMTESPSCFCTGVVCVLHFPVCAAPLTSQLRNNLLMDTWNTGKIVPINSEKQSSPLGEGGPRSRCVLEQESSTVNEE